MKTLKFEEMENLQGGALTNGELCLIGIGASIVLPSIWTIGFAMMACLSGDQ